MDRSCGTRYRADVIWYTSAVFDSDPSLMPALAGRMTLRQICAALGLLAVGLSPLAGQAAEPAADDAAAIATDATAEANAEAALNLDQSIQALKDEVLLFTRDARSAEDDFLYPPHTRVTFYLGVKTKGLLLDRVVYSIDDGAPQTLTYDDRAAKAFLKNDALQRIGRINLEKGPHRIRAEFSGRWADAKTEAPPLVGRMEAVFDKTLSETELELSVARARRGSAPEITLKQWKAAE